MYRVKFGKVNTNKKIYEKDEIIDELAESEAERLIKLGFIEVATASQDGEVELTTGETLEDGEVSQDDEGELTAEETLENGEVSQDDENELTAEEILKMNKDALKKLADEKNIDVNGLNASSMKDKLIAELFETPNTSL